MKKFIIGFLLGATIFGSIVGFATSYVAKEADFKVFVNDEEFISEQPILEVNDRTYIPLRAMGVVLGVPVKWNDDLKQVEVGDCPNVSKPKNDFVGYADYPWLPDFGYLIGKSPYMLLPSDDWEQAYVYDSQGVTENDIHNYLTILQNNGFEVKEVDGAYGFANEDRTKMGGIMELELVGIVVVVL